MDKSIKESTISRAEAMRRLNVNRYKIRQFVSAEQLQCFKVGSHDRYYPEQVEALRVQRSFAIELIMGLGKGRGE